MRRSLALCVALGCASAAGAQEPVDHAMAARIKDEGLNRSRVMELFNHLTNVIGPRTPRSSRSPGFNTLQDYQDYDVRTHHTNTDFYERLNPDDLKQAAMVLAVFAYQAAMRDQMIPRAQMTP